MRVLATTLGVSATVIAIVLGLLSDTGKKLLTKAFMSVIEYVQRRVTVSITFTWKDPAYDFIKEWLRDHPYAQRARNVRMVFDEKNKSFRSVPAPGLHWLWYRGPMWIRYGAPQKTVGDSVNEAVQQAFSSSLMVSDKDDYTVTMLTLDHRKIQRFMEEIASKPVNHDKDKNHTVVYTWIDGYWGRGYPKRKRPLDKVYMPEAQKQEVVGAVAKFLESEDRYMAWGIPYRFGIQLDGVTGTGKTTFATALAGHFDRPIYCLNLNSISNDNALMIAFRCVDHDGIVLIEDIDAFKCARRRPGVASEDEVAKNEVVKSKTPEAGDGKDGKVDGVTLSGLLNAIDGLGATEGRILIITTNDPTKLDPALVRAARIDLPVSIGPLGPDEVATMFKNFYPDSTHMADTVRDCARALPPKTAAVWQKLFIKHAGAVNSLVEEIRASNPYRS